MKKKIKDITTETIDSVKQKLKDDFPLYAETNLHIATKQGEVLCLKLNKAQLYLHEKLEKQLKETGKVRAIILKGRQQGCSTYVACRFYWKVTHREGCRVFILTHLSDATLNLFNMVDRLHKYCNPLVKPKTSVASAKEKYFCDLNSGYKVGTAGAEMGSQGSGVGRSQTVQLFHGSEVAFWKSADDHFAGAVQTVPDMDNTEIILESTANGLNNKYHDMWVEAEAGESDYEAIFIPWYWQEEYTKKPPEDWEPDSKDREYADMYKLDRGQLFWKERKTKELGELKFKQEYPANSTEAFQVSGDESYINAIDVLRAMKEDVQPNAYHHSPRIGGCDPARSEHSKADRTSFCFRQGRKVHEIASYKLDDTMSIVGLCISYIDTWKLDKLFVDIGGLGAGVYDRLKEIGYGNKVIGVNSSTTAIQDTRYSNKRAEMWGEMKKWILDLPCSIPDKNSLLTDLSMPHNIPPDSNGRLKIEKKEDMKKRTQKSPDEGDALALTFAFPVANLENKEYDQFRPAQAAYNILNTRG
jgi:hypothetical protein